ncbi:ATP-binding protein [Metabacillus dongyingensis]|uniref:AlbA family DNA-binding domain-containing protein n=1 Tax=Metabacillus dongyingensis TaxID=2874282 RepID=UPI003B8E0BF1
MLKGSIYNQEFFEAFKEDEKVFDVVSLQNIIEQSFGESNHLDFKEKFIKEDQISKLILAMANSGGGTIVFGISDDKKPVGLPEEEIKDPTDFQRKINSYLPRTLNFILQPIEYKKDIRYGDFSGKTFFVCYIPKQDRHIPFIAKKGSDKLASDKIYIRKNVSVETATNDDLEDMFKKRIIMQYEDLTNIDLEEHLVQLKLLYKNISKTNFTSFFSDMLNNATKFGVEEVNEHYPEEDYEEFIANMIGKKKKKIEMILEVTNIE